MNNTLDIDDYKLILINGYYRFVNHDEKILTTGFKSKEKLLEYKDCILSAKTATNICKNRYKEAFNL